MAKFIELTCNEERISINLDDIAFFHLEDQDITLGLKIFEKTLCFNTEKEAQKCYAYLKVLLVD